MTRGTDVNLAFVFTTPARPADPQPGTRPAPELDRYDRIRRERAGIPGTASPRPQPGQAGPARAGRRARRRPRPRRRRTVGLRDPAPQPGQRRPPRHPARDLDRRDPQPPATTGTATWSRPRCRPATGSRSPTRPAGCTAPCTPPNWPAWTPPTVIRTAIASRDLAGSRDIAAVLDARIRPRIDPLLPQPQGPWASRVPQLPDPARQAYLAEIAALMDDRTRRLGQHAAQTAPAWAITALGPVPADPAARRGLGAQGRPDRRLPRDVRLRPSRRPDRPRTQPPGTGPAGRLAPGIRRPRPGRPDPTSGPCPTAELWLLRDTYAAETAWAPRHAGKELRLARLGAFDAALGAIRADAEAAAARKAGDHDRAARHEHLAASYRSLRDHYQQREQTLAQAMADRQEWEHATARSRRLAIAADAELRRRHPGQKIEPLRSAEPAPASDHLHPAADGNLIETVAWIRDLARQREAFRPELDERPRLVMRQRELGKVSSAKTPGQDAMLQPPKPEIIPAARILQLAAEHDTEPGYEAAE